MSLLPPGASAAYLEEEVYVAPFKGWRAWNIGPCFQGLEGVITDGTLSTDVVSFPPPWRLRSLFNGRIWPVRQPSRRECFCNGDALSRSNGHTCGIYAFKDIPSMIPHLIMDLARKGKGRTLGPEELMAVGEVNLWGEVYVHEGGYRAEFAYPENIYFIEGFGHNRFAEQGMRDYGVEVGDISLLNLVDGSENEIIFHAHMGVGNLFPNERFVGMGMLEAAFAAVGRDFGYLYKLRLRGRGR